MYPRLIWQPVMKGILKEILVFTVILLPTDYCPFYLRSNSLWLKHVYTTLRYSFPRRVDGTVMSVSSACDNHVNIGYC